MTLDNKELLLSWLQQIYSIERNTLDFELLGYIDDNKIDPYSFGEKLKLSPGVLKICNIANPGWNLDFNYLKTVYKNNNLIEYDFNTDLDNADWMHCNQWLSVTKSKGIFNGGCGPLYLSVLLYVFRCFIENMELADNDLPSIRASLRKDNELLCWLEQLYFSCCDSDWEHTYGYSLVSTKTGWLMVLSVAEWDFGNKPFQKIVIQEEDGIVECYKLDSQFIIRAHFGGLITGLLKFRDWVEGETIQNQGQS